MVYLHHIIGLVYLGIQSRKKGQPLLHILY